MYVVDANANEAQIRVNVTEALYEQLLDAAVQRQLSTDPRYVNAENAEEQAEAEAEIERELDARLSAKYYVS